MTATGTWKPSRKVTVGSLAGAVTTIALWLVDELTPLQPPAAVAAAISLLVTVGVAYWLPARRGEPPATETTDPRQ